MEGVKLTDVRENQLLKARTLPKARGLPFVAPLGSFIRFEAHTTAGDNR
jgi:hypothetical protein